MVRQFNITTWLAFAQIMRSKRNLAVKDPSCRISGSTHWWRAPPPAAVSHRLPGLNRLMAEHPPAGLRDGIIRQSPVEGANGDPLGMVRRIVGAELTNQLLAFIDDPTLSIWLFRLLLGIGLLFPHALSLDPPCFSFDASS
tara:strand:+ start:892 stop:1314 length:423 start_codon:yes stop_codon:yes gene_type:complete